MKKVNVGEVSTSFLLSAHGDRGKVVENVCIEFLEKLVADSGITVTPSTGGPLEAAEQGLSTAGTQRGASTAFTDFRQTCACIYA